MSAHDPRLQQIARALVERCAVHPGERVFVLTDDGTVSDLTAAVTEAIAAAGATTLHRNVPGRTRVFADLPAALLDELLSPGLILDLTSLSWLYSDSLTRYARECAVAGSRLALVLADRSGLETILRCPPDDALFARALATLPSIQCATELAIASPLGTDFRATLAGEASFIGAPPITAGAIGAPLYASVTAPFAPGTASGRLVFTAAGRIQGPEIVPFTTESPITIEVGHGYVTGIFGESEVADLLRAWRAAAPSPEVDRIMDCNLGFDPRGDLAAADNMVVHCYAGGIMIGIGSPYEYRPAGSLKPDFHLDLLLLNADVTLDGVPLIRNGRITA